MQTQGARYHCPKPGHGSRSIAPVDSYIMRLIVARLNQPDIAAGFIPADGAAARQLAEKIAGLQQKRARRQDDYESELIDGRMYKTATDKIDAEIKALDGQRISLGVGREAASILGAANPGAMFANASTERQRLVIDAIATVKLHTGARYSKLFDPETVEVIWKTA